MRFRKLQLLAAGCVGASPIIVAPILANSSRADIGSVAAWGGVLGAGLILIGPFLPKRNAVRRLFYWGDAMSPAQLDALAAGRNCDFFRIGAEDGYSRRVGPYMLRLMAAGLLFAVCADLVPNWGRSGVPLLDALMVFAPVYLVFIGAGLLASLPWRFMFERRHDRN